MVRPCLMSCRRRPFFVYLMFQSLHFGKVHFQMNRNWEYLRPSVSDETHQGSVKGALNG